MGDDRLGADHRQVQRCPWFAPEFCRGASCNLLLCQGYPYVETVVDDQVVSWTRAEDVAAAVLDVAFADSAPQSLNIVNPQRARWSDIISSIQNAILEQKSLHSDRLTIVPFVEWLVRLEKRAANASSEDLAQIVSLPAYL